MKTLIAYSSRTGNTKMVAEAIGEVIENSQVIDIKDEPNIESYDNIIVGYWTDKGKADPIADKFLKEIKNKNCGVFATLGYYADTDYAKDIINYGKNILLDNNNKVHTAFICQGKIDPKLAEKFKSQSDSTNNSDDERSKRHEEAKSHPDSKDLENAKEAFSDFLEKIQN